MELVFNQINDRWEAEIKVTADFNLHIEGVREGNVSVFMRGTESGEYAYVRGATPYPSVGTVYEYDFSAVIFPKYIKVACATAPSLAVVTSAGEVIQIEKPVEPDTPSEPEDGGILTYAFNVPVSAVENEDGTYYSGTLNSDFSDIKNKMVKFGQKLNPDNIDSWSVEVVTSEDVNITVNGYMVEWIDYYGGEINLDLGHAYQPIGGNAIAVLNDNSIRTDLPAPWNPDAPKPESDIIEYHFDIPMEEQSEFGIEIQLYGELEGDYSETFERLKSYLITNGERVGDSLGVGVRFSEIPLENPKITINNLFVTDLYMPNENSLEIELGTNGGSDMSCDSTAFLTRTSISIMTPKQ